MSVPDPIWFAFVDGKPVPYLPPPRTSEAQPAWTGRMVDAYGTGFPPAWTGRKRPPLGERPDPLAPPEGYGSKPGQPEPAEAVDISDVCALAGCRLPVDILLTMGCINEHVFTLGYCAAHAELHQRRVLSCQARPKQEGKNMICGKQLRIGKIEPVM